MKSTTKLIAAAVTGIIGVAGIGATALAATTTNSGYPPIVQKLSDKFQLNPSDVQQVFKDNRAAHEKDHQARLESSLTRAVKDGKLTGDQKTELLAKLQKLHDEHQADRTQMKQDRHQFRDELTQWAKDNGITNLDDILPRPSQNMHPMR